MKYGTAINGSGAFGKRAKCPDGTSVSGGGLNVNEAFNFPYDLIESIPANYPPGSSTAKAWFTFINGPGMAATAATIYAVCMDDDDAKLKARREFFDSPMTTRQAARCSAAEGEADRSRWRPADAAGRDGDDVRCGQPSRREPQARRRRHGHGRQLGRRGS